MGADKYLLFPAWQGNEWEGRGSHCDEGVRDTDKPAGSFLPHWHLKAQYATSSALGQILCQLTVRAGDVCVRGRVMEMETETQKEGMGRRQADRQDLGDNRRERHAERKRVLLKRRVEKVSPLRAVYMTDHQRNSQDNRAKRIHIYRQCQLRERGAGVMNTHVPSGIQSSLCPLLNKINPIVIFLRQNKTGIPRGSQT